MEATYIAGGRTAVEAVLYGGSNALPNNAVLDTIGSRAFVNTSDFFNNSITNFTNIYNSDAVLSVARDVVSTFGAVFDSNAMYYITENNIRNANNMMKHVIMSHPEMIRLNNLGFIDGYGTVTGDVGLSDYVNSGDVVFSEDSLNYTTFDDLYYEDVYDAENVNIIKNTWDSLSRMLSKRIDPTTDDLRGF